MKPITTSKLADFVPKDQFSKATRAAEKDANQFERMTVSLQRRHVRMIKDHAVAMTNEKGEPVSTSEALRDLLDGRRS